jgi:FSR family fosmidomycin resistance protein-like MFS transporter
MVATYSIVHFFVDFACAFLMFGYVTGAPDGYVCVLGYNFCAFAMQMPLGIIADRLNKNHFVAIAGCALIGVAFALTGEPLAAVVVAGIGNAMFHIGGGIDVLSASGKKLGALGVFVSPGAAGVYLGTMLARGGEFPMLAVPLSLALAACAIYAMRRLKGAAYDSIAGAQHDGIIPSPRLSHKENSATADPTPDETSTHTPASQTNSPDTAETPLENPNPRRVLVAVSCLFLVVCLRSYAGLSMDFPWKSVAPWGVASLCAVVLGKTIGGFAADKFGVAKTAFLSLGVASVLLIFAHIPLAGVAAALLLNVTMPITLWAVAREFPSAKGFAFGLLTFGLFVGFLPAYLGIAAQLPALAPIAVLSLIFIVVGLWKVKA